jgi:hypothetical protein
MLIGNSQSTKTHSTPVLAIILETFAPGNICLQQSVHITSHSQSLVFTHQTPILGAVPASSEDNNVFATFIEPIVIDLYWNLWCKAKDLSKCRGEMVLEDDSQRNDDVEGVRVIIIRRRLSRRGLYRAQAGPHHTLPLKTTGAIFQEWDGWFAALALEHLTLCVTSHHMQGAKTLSVTFDRAESQAWYIMAGKFSEETLDMSDSRISEIFLFGEEPKERSTNFGVFYAEAGG